MSSIDQRIVEMQFDNQQFEKGIQTSLKSLTSLKQSLRLDRAKDGIDETAESVKNLAHQFTLFGRIALKVKDTIADLVVNRGKQLVKSLSIDQVSSGWTKYGQKTTSVQAIMNATGKSIDEVNGYLDKLMWFSDETSYSFTEMTSALGTMTSSGGDINKLIPMIEGMAAATSFAGKGAAEFSRVIYNLNQSYGQGYLSFLDWKSVEGANVNSEQLKQTLIDTAVALGTLKKDSKGVIRTAKNTIVTVANMGSTLNERVSVFSSALERLKRVARGVAAAADILWKGIKFVGTVAFSVLKVLAPLADALLTILAAIGDCFVALDKGLGVSELFSGVLATIIGWLEPVAKGVRKASDALLDFFGLGKKENGTNKSLMTFSKLWGNIKGKLKDWGVWDALTRAWNRLSEAAGNLGNAFKRLWASIKVAWQNLKAAIGEKFPTLFEKTKTGAANLWSKSITAIGIGLSKALDFITSVIHKLPAIKSKVAEFAKTAWTFLTDLWSRLEVSEKFGGIAARISNFFRTLWNAVSEFFIGGRGDTSSEEAKAEKKLSIFAKIAETLKNGWDKVSSTFKWVYNGITTLWRKIGGLDGIIDNAWSLVALFGAFSGVKLLRSISGFVKSISKIALGIPSILKKIPEFIENAGGVLESVSDYVKHQRRQNALKNIASAAKDFALAIGILVASIYVLGKMSPDELKRGGIALAGIAFGLFLLQLGFAKLAKVNPDVKVQFRGFFSLALAVLTLILVMKIINRMSLEDYLKGAARVAGMILALRLIMLGFGKFKKTNVSIKGMLNATTVKASQAILATIFTESLDAGVITAGEALIASAKIPTLYVTALNAIGGSINLSANESITALVSSTEALDGRLSEAEQRITRDAIISTVTESAEFDELADSANDALARAKNAQTQAETAQSSADAAAAATNELRTTVTQTANALSVVKTETSTLGKRVTTIESGVHIDGSTIGLYRSDSPYKSIITNSGWKILEGNTVLIDCSKTKLTAPRVVISDMLVTGNAAWKPGSDKHLRLLSYGRR